MGGVFGRCNKKTHVQYPSNNNIHSSSTYSSSNSINNSRSSTYSSSNTTNINNTQLKVRIKPSAYSLCIPTKQQMNKIIDDHLIDIIDSVNKNVLSAHIYQATDIIENICVFRLCDNTYHFVAVYIEWFSPIYIHWAEYQKQKNYIIEPESLREKAINYFWKLDIYPEDNYYGLDI